MDDLGPTLLKVHRCKLERIYIQSHSLIDFFKLRSATNKYHKLITFIKCFLNSNHILRSASNHCLHWKTINSLLHHSRTPALPTAPLRASLSQRFATFCSEKVSKLHLKLLSAPSTMPHTSQRIQFLLVLILFHQPLPPKFPR